MPTEKAPNASQAMHRPTPDLNRALRAAIRPEKLEPLFKRAGATNVKPSAAEVLQETAAASTSRFVTDSPRSGREEDQPGVGIDADLLADAEQAIEPSALQRAASAAKTAGAPSDEATLRPMLAYQLGRIAQEAVAFADEEDRPVCHNCVAIGAARAAQGDPIPLATVQAAPAAGAIPA